MWPGGICPPEAILPPEGLQQGVIAQAVQAYHSLGKQGQPQINAGQAGTASPHTLHDHPLLVAACQALRRWTL